MVVDPESFTRGRDWPHIQQGPSSKNRMCRIPRPHSRRFPPVLPQWFLRLIPLTEKINVGVGGRSERKLNSSELFEIWSLTRWPPGPRPPGAGGGRSWAVEGRRAKEGLGTLSLRVGEKVVTQRKYKSQRKQEVLAHLADWGESCRACARRPSALRQKKTKTRWEFRRSTDRILTPCVCRYSYRGEKSTTGGFTVRRLFADILIALP